MKRQSGLTASIEQWRRQRALELQTQGWRLSAIAQALGVTPGAVSQWLKAAREQGPSALVSRRNRTGRRPKLSQEQTTCLLRLLQAGAQEAGYIGRRWQSKRVAAKQAGSGSDPAAIWRFLSAHEHSPPAATLGMKPATATGAGQRTRRGEDRAFSAAVDNSQKGAQDEKRTIVFVDESGFSLLPAVVRTWAPKGQTPVLTGALSHEHLSSISALTTKGRLLTWTHDKSINDT